MSLLTEPALARFVALARAAAGIEPGEPAAKARWGRIRRVVASLPDGNAADRELADAWGLELLEELDAVGWPEDLDPFATLDLVTIDPWPGG